MDAAPAETVGETFRPVGQVNAWDPAPHRAWRLRWVVLGIVVLLGAWWMFSGGEAAPDPAAPATEAVDPASASPTPTSEASGPAPTHLTEAPAVVETTMTVEPEPAAPAIESTPLPEPETAEVPAPRVASTPEPATVTPVETPAASTPSVPVDGLHFPEFALGRDVRNKKLVGETDHFGEGSAAWFWTRAEGGKRGDRIEHVWLHEGESVARIGLRIGGSSWRTYSSKILRSTGEWTVEARDADGHVLARRDFSVSP